MFWNPYREGEFSALNSVQRREAKLANNINVSVWENLAQRKIVEQLCVLFKAYTKGWALKAIVNIFLNPCYLCRGDHNRKIKTRQQRTDVSKYSFINRTINSMNPLPLRY